MYNGIVGISTLTWYIIHSTQPHVMPCVKNGDDSYSKISPGAAAAKGAEEGAEGGGGGIIDYT